MKNKSAFISMLFLMLFAYTWSSQAVAQTYTQINSRQDICDKVNNDNDFFSYRIGGEGAGNTPQYARVFIPPTLRKFLSMTTGIQGGGGSTVKLALRFGQAPNNYSSGYSDYTNTDVSGGNHIRSIQEMTDSDRVIPLDTGQNATFDLFNIRTESGLAGGDDWFYVNAYSGVERVYSHTIEFMVDKQDTQNWCQGQQPDTGFLKVTIEPFGARLDGAQWKLTSGPDQGWKNSGSTVSDLDPGAYTVTFKDIIDKGWVKPGNISGINVEAGQRAEKTGTYTERAVEAGSLQVFIESEEARDEGRWKITWEEEGVWHEHGEVVGSIEVGHHEIEFKPVPGWIRPANQQVEIENNITLQTTGIYASKPVELQVILEPQEAREAPVKWRVDQGLWKESGDLVFLSPKLKSSGHDPYEIEFQDINNWKTPDVFKGYFDPGARNIETFHYGKDDEYGSLRVDLRPLNLSADAGWRLLGEDVWRDDGEPVEVIPAGSRTIEFKPVEDWVEPDQKSVVIITDEITVVEGEYLGKAGTLKINIQPEEVQGKSGWRIKGADYWWGHDYVYEDIVPDEYVLQFKPVVGWTGPADQTVMVNPGEEKEVSVEYHEITYGCIGAIITPDQAANDARWFWVENRDRGTFKSKESLCDFDMIGEQTIGFTQIDHWTEPGNKIIEVKADQTASVTGDYVRHKGNLRVLIEPEGSRDQGRWKRTAAQGWRYHNEVEYNIPTGRYVVEFDDISESTIYQGKPSNLSVIIEKDETRTITGTYTEEKPEVKILSGVLMLLLLDDEEEPEPE